MRMTIIKKKTGYTLGLSLCIIEIIMLLIPSLENVDWRSIHILRYVLSFKS